MTALACSGLTVRRGGRCVLDDVSFAVAPGEVVGLLGPNGSGKTTLMRAAMGMIPATGTSSLWALDPLARARQVAFLPQSREIAWPMPVEEVVALGRLPHRRAGAGPDAADRAAVARAMDRCGLTAFAGRDATRLSGGEQGRVLIARAMAQDTPLLIADEPAAGLDPAHQLRILAAFADLAAEGRAVLLSLHDLPLAARACDRLLLLDAGRLVADGLPASVLTPAHIGKVFGIRADWIAGRFAVQGLA